MACLYVLLGGQFENVPNGTLLIFAKGRLYGTRWCEKCLERRDSDFPFQKLVFSVSENLEFRFSFNPKRKFRFVIKIVHIKKHEFHFARVNSIIFHVKTLKPKWIFRFDSPVNGKSLSLYTLCVSFRTLQLSACLKPDLSGSCLLVVLIFLWGQMSSM